MIRSSFPHLEAGHTGCEVIDKAVGTEMGGEVAASALPVLVALVRVGEDPVLVTILTHCSPKREEEEGKQHGCYVNLDYCRAPWEPETGLCSNICASLRLKWDWSTDVRCCDG